MQTARNPRRIPAGTDFPADIQSRSRTALPLSLMNARHVAAEPTAPYSGPARLARPGQSPCATTAAATPPASTSAAIITISHRGTLPSRDGDHRPGERSSMSWPGCPSRSGRIAGDQAQRVPDARPGRADPGPRQGRRPATPRLYRPVPGCEDPSVSASARGGCQPDASSVRSVHDAISKGGRGKSMGAMRAYVGENFGTYLARLPDLRGSPLLAAADRTGRSRILAGHQRCHAAGGRAVFASAQAAAAVFDTAPPRRRSPVHAPGLTCGFWWQVQDSNLGRLSSAILQTVPGTALTCADIRVIRHFGMHLT